MSVNTGLYGSLARRTQKILGLGYTFMETVEKRKKALKLCTKIIGVVCIPFIILYLIEGNYFGSILILIAALAVCLPVFLGIEKFNIEKLCKYFVAGVGVLVLCPNLSSGEINAAAPLFICGGAISAMFFETSFVKIGYCSAFICYVADIVIMSIIQGHLVMEVIVMAECLLAVAVCAFLVHQAVKNGTEYLEKADENRQESERLLQTVNEKMEAEKAAAEKSRELLLEIDAVSNSISMESDKLSAEADLLARGASEQASSVEKLAASIKQMSEKIEETAGHAHGVSQESSVMNENVEIGSQKMSDMLQAVGEIYDSSVAIEKIIKTIEDIAFQTNILALNAAVEAARAGTAGKGFAVVADEVRNLAAKSADAAKETTELITFCLTAIKKGNVIAEETAESLNKIKDSVKEVSEQTFFISDMTDMQSTMIGDINEGINQVSSVIQTTAATAQESAAASKELLEQSRKLKDMSGRK